MLPVPNPGEACRPTLALALILTPALALALALTGSGSVAALARGNNPYRARNAHLSCPPFIQ